MTPRTAIPLGPLLTLSLLFAAALAAAEPAVFFVEPGIDGCAWNLWEPKTARTRRLDRTPSCPAEILFDGARALFVAGDELRERGAGGERLLARLPEGAAGESYARRLWLSAKTGRPRVAYMVPVADEEVGGAQDAAVFRHEGREYKAEGYLPPWGSAQLAVIDEVGADGRWARLALVPTKWEAGDTPGFGVLDTRIDRKPGVVSIAEAVDALGCFAGACGDAPQALEPAARRLAAAWTEPEAEEPAQAGYLQAPPDGHLLFQLEYGDLPHAAPPVHWCSGDCARTVELLDLPGATPGGALAVSARAGHILVSREDGADLRVYRAGKREPVLARAGALSACWLDAAALPRER